MHEGRHEAKRLQQCPHTLICTVQEDEVWRVLFVFVAEDTPHQNSQYLEGPVKEYSRVKPLTKELVQLEQVIDGHVNRDFPEMLIVVIDTRCVVLFLHFFVLKCKSEVIEHKMRVFRVQELIDESLEITL